MSRRRAAPQVGHRREEAPLAHSERPSGVALREVRQLGLDPPDPGQHTAGAFNLRDGADGVVGRERVRLEVRAEPAGCCHRPRRNTADGVDRIDRTSADRFDKMEAASEAPHPAGLLVGPLPDRSQPTALAHLALDAVAVGHPHVERVALDQEVE